MNATTRYGSFFTNLVAGMPHDWDGELPTSPPVIKPNELERATRSTFNKNLDPNRPWWRLDLTESYLPRILETWDTEGFDGLILHHPKVVQRVARNIIKRAEEVRATKRSRKESGLVRRSYYLPRATMRFGPTKDQSKLRWSFDPNLEPQGLLAHYLAHRGMLPDEAPVSVRILNENIQLFVDKNGQERLKKFPIDDVEWAFWRDQGVLPTKGNLGWWWGGAVREILLKAFPDAISFNSYCQRLASPLEVDGYRPEIKVLFSKVKLREDGSPVFCLDPDYSDPTLVDSGADGSHYYNQDSLLVAAGHSMQLSLLNGSGVFAKGIAEPHPGDQCYGYDVIIDPDQVKGAWKGIIGEGDTQVMDLGILRLFKKSKYPLLFEALQFLNPEKHVGGKNGFRADIESLMEEAFTTQFKQGPLSLLRSMSESSDQLKLVLGLIEALELRGTKLNPMSIPLVNSALSEALKKWLWGLFQGLAFKGDQLEVKTDARLQAGECIAYGYKPGEEVAVWRVPVVLPQGLRTLKCIPKGARALPEGRIYMPRFDILAQQGDDDGDVVGATSDNRVKRLFACRYTDKVYAIEPKGEKMHMSVESPEGMDYLQRDPRGPVGVTTLWQAEILAVPKHPRALWYALALGVLNQYAIDSAKRAVMWPCLDYLSNPRNWKLEEDGFYHCRNVPQLYPDQTEVMDMPIKVEGEDDYGSWMYHIKTDLGIIRTVNGHGGKEQIVGNALAWRVQEDALGRPLNKRIDFMNWQPCSAKSEGFRGGNVVHACHDLARRMFVSRLKKMGWNVPSDSVLLRDVLLRALKLPWSTQYDSFQEYEKGVRRLAGVKNFGKQYGKILRTQDDPNQRALQIDWLTSEFEAACSELTRDELLEIWYWENTTTYCKHDGRRRVFVNYQDKDTWEENKPNQGLRAVLFTGSPLLQELELEREMVCPWQQAVMKKKGNTTVLSKQLHSLITSTDPWEQLVERLYSNTSHGKLVVDADGEPIHLHECHSCSRLVMGTAMRQFRAEKTVGEKQFMIRLVEGLRNADIDRSLDSNKSDKDWDRDDELYQWLNGD